LSFPADLASSYWLPVFLRQSLGSVAAPCAVLAQGTTPDDIDDIIKVRVRVFEEPQNRFNMVSGACTDVVSVAK
jgi:hypothetical protein